MSDAPFAYCKIFPPIGIARLGNSEEGAFIGPEVPGVVPSNGGGYKDAAGAIKRQAARFRVYAFDANDRVVAEVTADAADIVWTVSLANKKAAWHRFAGASGVNQVLTGGAEAPALRNANVEGDDRTGLVIGPATGTVTAAQTARLEGHFVVRTRDWSHPAEPVKVALGELRTDEAGRLLVLGGHGKSGSVLPDNPLNHYANNDGWYDDTSDGSVEAVVTLKDGTDVPVRGRAWVIVASPHYSPHTENIVSLYDVLSETAVEHSLPWAENELGPRPRAADPVSFTRDIYPILRRLVRYQWVSNRARRGHSAGKPGDFLDEDTLKVLSDPGKAGSGSPHARIFDRLRTPILTHPLLGSRAPSEWELLPNTQAAINQANLSFMPPLAGDEGDVSQGDPSTWLSLTATQYRLMKRWQKKDFVGDWPGPAPAAVLSDIPVERQPAALTRASLEACQGGAFFPGIEMCSIARYPQTFAEAFRLADDLTPGDVTRWMALPWQADFYECRDHWWPSVRPDDVVPDEEYERILGEFKGEAESGRLESLLVVRKPWARGLALTISPRPSLPPLAALGSAGGAPGAYRSACQLHLAKFTEGYFRVFPAPLDQEPMSSYERRATEFLFSTVVAPGGPFAPPPPGLGENPMDYRRRVVAAVRAYLGDQTVVPPPEEGEEALAYAERLAVLAGAMPSWQGLFDTEWRRRVAHQGKNDLVREWPRLGFVTPRTNFGKTALVESERGRHELLSFREYFYFLMNLEHNADFLPKARDLADEYLRLAWELEPELRASPAFEQFGFFAYDPVTFQARLEKIYEGERRAAMAYNPANPEPGSSEGVFRTARDVVERIRQLAPFNQLDGSWLERATKAGPIAEVQSALFEIWSDEIGNGNPAQNHANVYTDLLHSAGLYLPPLRSRAYAENPDIWDGSYASPAYQTALAYFPEQYFPELLGMTLYLEWEAIYLHAMVRLYEFHGYSSLFYRLHVAIDNPVNGHGARARDAVIRYLDHIREESGEREVQQHWQRIWNGYLAFKLVGGDNWEYRLNNPPTPEERMLALVEQKRHYGQMNHGTKKLGPNFINDWFDEPGEFLKQLVESDLITKGDAKRSRIFDLISFNGPMLKVFTAQDREVLAEWINSLPPDPVGAALDPAEAMRVLVRKYSARGAAAPEHEGPRLKGKYIDPSQSDVEVEVTQPVAWWFRLGQPERLMAALIDSGWVVPGKVAESRFVRELLTPPRRMSKFLIQTIPELGNKSARQVIIEWIADGCRIPVVASERAARAVPAAANERATGLDASPEADEYAREVQARTRHATPLTTEQRSHLNGRRYGPGGGAPH